MARKRETGQKTGHITSDASPAQARQNAAYFKKLLQGGHAEGGTHGGHGSAALREVHYKGHHIVIETTYRITIDDKPFEGELGVTNDGIVHYHGMPTAGFDSAVDLVKSVIDTFPAEFAPGAHDEHSGHDPADSDDSMHTHPSRTAKPRRPARAASSRTRRPR